MIGQPDEKEREVCAPVQLADAQPLIELVEGPGDHETTGEPSDEPSTGPFPGSSTETEMSDNSSGPAIGTDKPSAAINIEAPALSRGNPASSFTGRLAYFLKSLEEVIAQWLDYLEGVLRWIWELKTPILLIAAIFFDHRIILLWILIVISKPILTFLCRRLPESWRSRGALLMPASLRNSRFLREVNEGAEQGLPFVLFWLYLCCAPFAMLWMGWHWLCSFVSPRQEKLSEANGFVLTQNKSADSINRENNFYHSRIFAIVFLAFFALGIPAFVSYEIYDKLGIEKVLMSEKSFAPSANVSSRMPATIVPKVGVIYGKPGVVSVAFHPRVVVGYSGYWPLLEHFGVSPRKGQVIFVHFYLMSMAVALSMLFFRAWFTFPLNFLSDEHDIEFSEWGVRRKNLKSWFLNVLTINRWAIGGGPDSLAWNEVKSLRRYQEGFTRLWPLPETAFKKESLTYKLLNKSAAFIDGLCNKVNTGNYLAFSSTEAGDDFGRNIKINLNDLTREQRARLFYAVKNWAPHVLVSQAAEEQLLGSTVLRDNRYTKLWFDILTSRTTARNQHMLSPGDCLKSGDYTLLERISSGGQATAYVARKASESGAAAIEDQVVLKEFILAKPSSSDSLLESAREFESEVSLLSQLNHPGIVRLEDFFYDSGRVYVVLEHIQGQSLRQRVQQHGPLSEGEAIEVALSICDVLEYLHGCTPPVVHRDITPENILFQPDGSVKLIDFSLAVKNDGRQPTESCGKQCFTPPEQFREEISPQSDIYALGATMYYLLTGQTPKPISVSSPRAKLPEISEELNAIVWHATQLDVSQRYDSIRWLKIDLARLKENILPTVPDHECF